MTRRALALSANARPGAGGQGLNLQHMIEALEQDFDLRVFCQGPRDGRTAAVPPHRLVELARRVPWVRRRRDWLGLSEDVHFDRWVAAHLPPARVVQGAVGQCAETLEAARRRGAATVLDAVNTHVDDFHGHVLRECRKMGLEHVLHPEVRQRTLREYRLADVIRVMSERARRTFVERGVPAEKIVTAMPPVDVDACPQARFDGPRFRVSFVGLLEPWKGVQHLLEAFDRMRLPDAELVLWGGSGSRPMSELLARHQARQPSIQVRPVSVREVGLEEVYGRTSVLVHPSLADGFSYAVAEAMACGVPVVVSDNTGAADLVVDGENGYVVPGGDVGALADRVGHLARHPEILPAMGAKAREAARRLTPEGLRAPLVGRIRRLA